MHSIHGNVFDRNVIWFFSVELSFVYFYRWDVKERIFCRFIFFNTDEQRLKLVDFDGISKFGSPVLQLQSSVLYLAYFINLHKKSKFSYKFVLFKSRMIKIATKFLSCLKNAKPILKIFFNCRGIVKFMGKQLCAIFSQLVKNLKKKIKKSNVLLHQTDRFFYICLFVYICLK